MDGVDAEGWRFVAFVRLAVVAFLPRIARRFRSANAITPKRLRALIAEGGVQVVDLRDAPEFHGEAGFIGGARNIPLPELPSRVEELAEWRDGGLVLICRTHVRSGKAARLLAERGFNRLSLVRGGMNAWGNLGYPTETAAALQSPRGV